MSVRSWTDVVRLLAPVHQVLLDADAQVPVRAGDVHQLGQGVHLAQVVHLGQVGQLPPWLPVGCRLVDRVEQSGGLVKLGLWLKLLSKLLLWLELLCWLLFCRELWLSRWCSERLSFLRKLLLLLLKLLRLEGCE